MSQYFRIHPRNPQPRLIARAVDIIRGGGVIAYPTDSSYALGCALGDKQAMTRIRRIRQLDADHNFTLVCRDLSAVSSYAKVGNAHYRLLKRFTPGAFTFILNATREVPRRLQHPKRRSIGLRVPHYPIVAALLTQLGEPLMSVTLIMPGESLPLNEPNVIRERLEHSVDLVIDGGPCDARPTTVVGLLTDTPEILRHGRGDAGALVGEKLT